jgi:hypothetical protein
VLSRGAPKLCGEALKTCFNSVVNHCSCPLWVDGTFSGRRYHKTLNTRNWDTAQKLTQELEAAGKPEPAAKTIQDIRRLLSVMPRLRPATTERLQIQTVVHVSEFAMTRANSSFARELPD